MLHVIAYDISDDDRREEIARVLEGYGQRVQYSVFEVECDLKELSLLVERLEPLVGGVQDALRVYRVCATCAAETIVLGRAPDPGLPMAWIV